MPRYDISQLSTNLQNMSKNIVALTNGLHRSAVSHFHFQLRSSAGLDTGRLRTNWNLTDNGIPNLNTNSIGLNREVKLGETEVERYGKQVAHSFLSKLVKRRKFPQRIDVFLANGTEYIQHVDAAVNYRIETGAVARNRDFFNKAIKRASDDFNKSAKRAFNLSVDHTQSRSLNGPAGPQEGAV